MKRILYCVGLGGILFLFTPWFMWLGISRSWSAAFKSPVVGESVWRLVCFGRRNLGLFPCGITICTSTKNKIWEKEGQFFCLDIPKAVRRMRVAGWFVENGRVWIWVIRDEDLLAKLKRELAEKAQKNGEEKKA